VGGIVRGENSKCFTAHGEAGNVKGGGDSVINRRDIEGAGSFILKGGDGGKSKGLDSQLITGWQMTN
jgi:hypothetical protein